MYIQQLEKRNGFHENAFILNHSRRVAQKKKGASHRLTTISPVALGR
jgi:hypothetical protein